jgi:hypothetical protein
MASGLKWNGAYSKSSLLPFGPLNLFNVPRDPATYSTLHVTRSCYGFNWALAPNIRIQFRLFRKKTSTDSSMTINIPRAENFGSGEPIHLASRSMIEPVIRFIIHFFIIIVPVSVALAVPLQITLEEVIAPLINSTTVFFNAIQCGLAIATVLTIIAAARIRP